MCVCKTAITLAYCGSGSSQSCIPNGSNSDSRFTISNAGSASNSFGMAPACSYCSHRSENGAHACDDNESYIQWVNVYTLFPFSQLLSIFISEEVSWEGRSLLAHIYRVNMVMMSDYVTTLCGFLQASLISTHVPLVPGTAPTT